AEALNRGHVTPVGLEGQQGATLDRGTVDQDAAGTALTRFAADLRARQFQPVPQQFNEQCARVNLEVMGSAVDRERKLHSEISLPICHAGKAGSSSSTSPWLNSTMFAS